jgi:catechol 2,3-dioxygenase
VAESIHPDTTIGAVHLTISNLDRSLDFYQNILGFKVHRRNDDTANLGAGGPDLLVLTQDSSAPRLRGTTGLYHFAILVPSRLDLAQSLQRIAETRTPVQGFADHGVSEAIYLPDPDDNGIEIYRDRPRDEWPIDNGRLRMVSDPLDIDGILGELKADEPWMGLAAKTTIGHVHLHVSRLDDTQAFYCDILGFDLMQRLAGSALFVSAGGYHHHIGLNAWQGVGAPPPPPDAVGLRHFVVKLPDRAELERVLNRVQRAGVSIEGRDGGALVRDPSQNGVLLTSSS